MKLIRWLLSNIVLIIFVLALCYAYVYWDNLTGEDTPAGKAIAWVSEEFEEFGGLLAYLKVSGNDAQETTESKSDNQVVASTRVETTVPASMPITEQSVALAPETTDRYVTPEIEQSLSRVIGDEIINATTNDAPEEQIKTTRELWIDARKAFHRRDFEKSINSYEQLISKTQDNFDAYGELGNVYFNQGNMKQAASSYYEAAAILFRLGQVERASSVMGVLNRLDPEKAQELQALITSDRS